VSVRLPSSDAWPPDPHPLRVSTICSVFVRMMTLKRSRVLSATLQWRITLIRIPAIRMQLGGSGELSPRMGSPRHGAAGCLRPVAGARTRAASRQANAYHRSDAIVIVALTVVMSAATRCSRVEVIGRGGQVEFAVRKLATDGRPIDDGPKLLTGINHPKGSPKLREIVVVPRLATSTPSFAMRYEMRLELPSLLQRARLRLGKFVATRMAARR
jgi:hypothetical protein